VEKKRKGKEGGREVKGEGKIREKKKREEG